MKEQNKSIGRIKETQKIHKELIKYSQFNEVEVNEDDLEDYDWLIEQAEENRRYREQIESHAPEGRKYTNDRYVKLLHERNKYREALEYYASVITWLPDDTDYSDADKYTFKIARKALEDNEQSD